MDVGGKYSGIVSGIMNMVGNIDGAPSPLVFGVLAQFGSWAAVHRGSGHAHPWLRELGILARSRRLGRQKAQNAGRTK